MLSVYLIMPDNYAYDLIETQQSANKELSLKARERLTSSDMYKFCVKSEQVDVMFINDVAIPLVVIVNTENPSLPSP